MRFVLLLLLLLAIERSLCLCCCRRHSMDTINAAARAGLVSGSLGDGVPQLSCPDASRRCNYPTFDGCQDANTCTGTTTAVRRHANGSASTRTLPCTFCGGSTSRANCPAGCAFEPGHCNKEFCCVSADLRLGAASGPAGERRQILNMKAYDPRVRPWYKSAVDKFATSGGLQTRAWSEIYKFVEGDLGITATIVLPCAVGRGSAARCDMLAKGREASPGAFTGGSFTGFDFSAPAIPLSADTLAVTPRAAGFSILTARSLDPRYRPGDTVSLVARASGCDRGVPGNYTVASVRNNTLSFYEALGNGRDAPTDSAHCGVERALAAEDLVLEVDGAARTVRLAADLRNLSAAVRTIGTLAAAFATVHTRGSNLHVVASRSRGANSSVRCCDGSGPRAQRLFAIGTRAAGADASAGALIAGRVPHGDWRLPHGYAGANGTTLLLVVDGVNSSIALGRAELHNESAAAGTIDRALGARGRAYMTPHGYLVVESASRGNASRVVLHPSSGAAAKRLLAPALTSVIGVDLSLRNIGFFLRREFDEPVLVYIIETATGRLMGTSLPLVPPTLFRNNTSAAELCGGATAAAAAGMLGTCATRSAHELIQRSAMQLESVGFGSGDFVVNTNVSAEARAMSFQGLRWTLVVLQTHDCDPGQALQQSRLAAGASSIACANCPRGYFSAVGMACTACPAGKFSGAAAAVCTSCSTGRVDEDRNASTACTTCTSGRSPAPDASTCKACAPGRAGSDGVCLACLGSLVSKGIACVECAKGTAPNALHDDCVCAADYYNASRAMHVCYVNGFNDGLFARAQARPPPHARWSRAHCFRVVQHRNTDSRHAPFCARPSSTFQDECALVRC